MNKMDEVVIQFTVDDLKDYEILKNFDENSEFYLKKFNKEKLQKIFIKMGNDKKLYNMKRGDLENNPKFRHLIQYFLVVDKNTSEVVVYKRKKPTETRLVDNCSIGWGGHIQLEDQECFFNPLKTIDTLLLREMVEEIKITSNKTASNNITVDCANDVYVLQTNDNVGSVHLGIVYFINVNEIKNSVESNEEENIIVDYIKFDELKKKIKNNELQLESWSKAIQMSEEIPNSIYKS